jgi:hypothetical protein
MERHSTAARHCCEPVASLARTRPPTTTQEIIVTTTTSSVAASGAADDGRTAGHAATDPAGPTGRLATWLAATTLSDIPAGVRERAKYLLLDGVGCALVGAQLPVSRVGVEGVLAFDPAGSGVLVGGVSEPPARSRRRC